MESPAGAVVTVGMGRRRESGAWKAGLPDEKERNGRREGGRDAGSDPEKPGPQVGTSITWWWLRMSQSLAHSAGRWIRRPGVSRAKSRHAHSAIWRGTLPAWTKEENFKDSSRVSTKKKDFKKDIETRRPR